MRILKILSENKDGLGEFYLEIYPNAIDSITIEMGKDNTEDPNPLIVTLGLSDTDYLIEELIRLRKEVYGTDTEE